jgi:WD40 repeat protein
LSAEIANAHSGSVQRLSWAHPQFGKILASCSIDGEVNVYEVKVDAKTNQRSFKVGSMCVCVCVCVCVCEYL